MTLPSTPREQQPIPGHLLAYAIEIRIQGSAAEASFQSLERHLAERRTLGKRISQINRDGGPLPLQLERAEFEKLFRDFGNLIGPILGDIQSFLAAVGIVASILWPSIQPRRGVTKERIAHRMGRAQEIRQILSVSENSPIRTRTRGRDDARGGLLHFDEMVEEFIATHPSRKVVTFDIGSSRAGTDSGRSDAIRWLDEDTLDLWVNGRRSNLREVREGLQQTLSHLNISGRVDYIFTNAPLPTGDVPIGFSVAAGAEDTPSVSKRRSPRRSA